MVDDRCYYYEDVLLSSYDQAQAGCAGKFQKGGRLFEPLTLGINNLVLAASRDVVSASNYFYIGVKRSVTIGSDYKLISSNVTVPFDINWHSSGMESSYQCAYALNGDSFIWDCW